MPSRGQRVFFAASVALAAMLAPGACPALDPASANVARLVGARRGGDAAFAGRALTGDSLPPAADMRGEIEALRVNFVQQGNRNACAAFAATSAMELEWRRLGHEIDLSEQYALWAAQEAGADPRRGLTFPQLARGLIRHGMCREELMPYKSADQIIAPSEMAAKDAAAMPGVKALELVPFDVRIGFSPADIFAVCRELSRLQPVCMAARWDESGGKLARGNILEDGPVTTGHMILLTGYELSPANPAEGFFHFRNSWGLAWGDFGYAKMPFSYARKHGLGAVVFRLDWTKAPAPRPDNRQPAAGGAGGATAAGGAGAAAGAAAGFDAFLATALGVGLALLVIAVWVPASLLATRRKGPLGVVGYALEFLVLYAVMAWCTGALLLRAGGGNDRVLLALLGAIGVLLALWFRLTIKHFGMGPGKAFGHMLLVGVLWNAAWWVADRLLPGASYRVWREAIAGAAPTAVVRLLGGTEDERRAYLDGARHRQTANDSSAGGETAWLRAWQADLDEERRRLNPAHQVANYYHATRVAILERRKAAAKTSAGAPAPAPAAGGNVAPPAPPGPPGAPGAPAVAADRAELNRRVWALYRELEQEKAALDPRNAEAVRRFNKKLAAYNELRAQSRRQSP